MTSNAFSGVGTKLYRSTTGVQGSYTALSEVNNISGPGMSRDTIDVTSLDSIGGYREFITSFRDSGEVSFEMNMTNENYDLLISDFESDALRFFKIVLPDDLESIFSFSGLITSIPLTIPMDDKVTVNVTIKISGQTTFVEGSSTTTTT